MRSITSMAMKNFSRPQRKRSASSIHPPPQPFLPNVRSMVGDTHMSRPERSNDTIGFVGTKCYSTQKVHDAEADSKPLPSVPGGISMFYQKPGIPTEEATLAPLEQQLLQCLQWLDRPSHSSKNILVNLGAEAFWMSAKDANMLQRMEMLTETLSMRQKNEVWTRLEILLLPQHRYPLKQVLRYGAAVIVERQDQSDIRCTQNRDLLTSHEAFDEPVVQDSGTRDLTPEPLRTRKRARLSHEDDIFKCKSEGCACSTAGCDQDAQEDIPCPVIVERMRAAPVQTKVPGSVRNALNDLYTKPRAAPQPPSPTRTSSSLPEPSRDVRKQPGSVRAGRLAAERALGCQIGTLLPPNFVFRNVATMQQGLDGAASAHPSRNSEDEACELQDDTRSFPMRLASLPYQPMSRRHTDGESRHPAT